jgi:hypothetical protein
MPLRQNREQTAINNGVVGSRFPYVQFPIGHRSASVQSGRGEEAALDLVWPGAAAADEPSDGILEAWARERGSHIPPLR